MGDGAIPSSLRSRVGIFWSYQYFFPLQVAVTRRRWRNETHRYQPNSCHVGIFLVIS
ncbi:hypothetical protein Hanom_Chr03g00258261 [Helianthus anomalus]